MTEDPSALISAIGNPGRPRFGISVKKRVVAAGGLGSTLDDVARRDSTGQLIEIISLPTEMVSGGTDDHRSVGDTSGDHDIGVGRQCFDDAPGAEVRVGRQRGAESEFVCPRDQIVALDVGDLRVQPQPGVDLAQRVGQSGRVETAGIRDDLHALVERKSEGVFHLSQERLRVAERRVLHPVPSEDQHRQFGKVVAGQVVEFAALEHLAHRRDAVAVETGAVTDPYRTHLSTFASRAARPSPLGPANACANPNHSSASAPTATRSRLARLARWVTSRQKSNAGPVTFCGASSGPQVQSEPSGAVNSTRKSSAGGVFSLTEYAKFRVRTPR